MFGDILTWEDLLEYLGVVRLPADGSSIGSPAQWEDELDDAFSEKYGLNFTFQTADGTKFNIFDRSMDMDLCRRLKFPITDGELEIEVEDFKDEIAEKMDELAFDDEDDLESWANDDLDDDQDLYGDDTPDSDDYEY